jgi:hypothetical protein
VPTPAELLRSAVTQLLTSERFVAAVQEISSRTLAARGTLDRSIKSALASMNLPSTADVAELRRRLDDLDRLMTELHAKLASIEQKVARPVRKGGKAR